MMCKFCNKEVDEKLDAPDQNRKVLKWHWTCFQYLAINGLLHVESPSGEDYTERVLEVEFGKDEASK
jgi:hypothetical protein